MPYFINLSLDAGGVRYSRRKFMEGFPGGAYDVFNSYFINRLRGLPVVGEYRLGASGVGGESDLVGEYRPDAVSERLYGDTQYWWLLLEYNGVGVGDLKFGVVLRYFALEDLETVYHTLAQRQLR